MDSSELSSEMIMEIISRTSLQTLDTMRCASRELNALAYESYLLDLYMKRNKIVSGFLIQCLKRGWMYIKEFAPSPQSTSLDLRFLPYNARILAASEQGIIVFHHRDPTNYRKELYHVCKPATKQVLALPNPRSYKYTGIQKFAIVVMNLKPLHYKIIRFSDHPAIYRRGKFYTAYRCDAFDSRTWEWRPLSLVKLSDYVFLSNQQPIIKSGSVYMLLTNNDILRVDVVSGKCKVLPCPIPYECTDTSRPTVELVKYGGRLGMACNPDGSNNWEIWVMRMGGQVWKKIYVWKKREDERWSLKALQDSDTSVMVDAYTLVFHRRFSEDEGDKMVGKVVLHDIPYQIFTFRSDFEPVDFNQP